MSKKVFLSIAVLSFASGWAATYKIDAAHSNVGFKVKHLAISTVRGNFGKFEGTLDFDPAKPSSLKAQATIDAKSIDTKEPKRDQHLMADDFFSAEKFPEIKFVSKKADLDKSGKGTLTGDLTIRGVTQPVTMDVEFLGTAKDPWGNNKASFSGTTKINRKDFGIKWNETLDNGGLVVSDEVDVILDIEANLMTDKGKSKGKKS